MIEETLEDLLHEHEMVVVPGLGAFLTQPAPAEVNFGSHQVAPPSKSIVFNPKVLAGGSKLTEALALTMGSSQEYARQAIENYTDVLKEQLTLGGKAWVGRLGELNLGSDGSLQFNPNPTINLLPESFGLSPVHVVPVALQVRKKEERKGFVVPIDPAYSSSASRRNGARVRILATRVLPIAASLSGLLIAGAAIYWLNTGRPNMDMADFNPFNKKELFQPSNTQAASESPAVQTPAEVSKESTIPEAPQAFQEDIQPEETMVVEHAPIVISQSFFVVAGSFSKEENLVKMKGLLASKGYEAIEMEEKTPSGATRIAAASFTSKEEARQFIAEKQTEFEEQLWVFTK